MSQPYNINNNNNKGDGLEKVKEFLDEFTSWPKEQRDEYTRRILEWIYEILISMAKTSNKIKLLYKLKKLKNQYSDRIVVIPVILLYCVKPEFRNEFSKIIQAIGALMRKFGSF